MLLVIGLLNAAGEGKVSPPVQEMTQSGLGGHGPEWKDLSVYSRSRTPAQLRDALANTYLPYCPGVAEAVLSAGALRLPHGGDGGLTIPLAENGTAPAKPPRYWRTRAELPPAAAGMPLAGLRIALDPGHIGGDYAAIEQRSWSVERAGPLICEGDLTLLLARHLKPRLEALGAAVTLVRTGREPLTDATPEQFAGHPRVLATPPAGRAQVAERLAYVTAEIRARARRVNEVIRPDIALCLHLNAAAWADPAAPALVPENHAHVIINGAYLPDELAREDVRLAMWRRLLSGVYEEERALGLALAHAVEAQTGLPPFTYTGRNAVQVGGNPYLWARNLLANRLYRCPTLFLELYVANSVPVYPRLKAVLQAEAAGEPLPEGNLIDEYADAVVAGLVRYYSR